MVMVKAVILNVGGGKSMLRVLEKYLVLLVFRVIKNNSLGLKIEFGVFC